MEKTEIKSNKSSARARNILGGVFSFLSTFIVSAVVIIAVGMIALNLFGFELFTVESGSMSPEYPKDSVVFVKDVPPEQLREGDVVTYVMDAHGTLVTHRVVETDAETETLITKGDANSSNDPSPVMWGNVVGRVEFGLPVLGAALRIIQSEAARPYLIAAVVVFGAVSIAGDIAEKRRKKKEKAAAPAETAGETADE